MRSVFVTFLGKFDPPIFWPTYRTCEWANSVPVNSHRICDFNLCSSRHKIGEICSCLHFFLCGKKLSILGEKFVSLRSISMHSSPAPATTSCFAASVARRRPPLSRALPDISITEWPGVNHWQSHWTEPDSDSDSDSLAVPGPDLSLT